MVTPLLDSNRRLQMYINCRTTILPEDIYLYKPGQLYENCCLFCRNPDSKIPVLSGGKDTDTNMCSYCSDECEKNMEMETEDLDKYIIKRKLLFASLDIATQWELPVDLKKFYTHLNGSTKDYFCGMGDRCYICERLPTTKPYSDEEEFDTIQIPVRSDRHLSGGKVHICTDTKCQQIKNDYNWLLEELTEHNKHSKQTELREVTCPTCRKDYLVLGAEEEIKYRAEMPDTYEWQCPSCAYQMLNSWEKDPDFQIFYPEVIGDPRKDLIQRAYTRNCHYCKQPTSIDLYQTEFSFALNHLIDHKICCKECASIRTWLQQNIVFRILDSSLYAELFADGTFNLYRLRRGDLENVIYNGNTGTNDQVEAVCIMMDEIGKLLVSTTDLLN